MSAPAATATPVLEFRSWVLEQLGPLLMDDVEVSYRRPPRPVATSVYWGPEITAASAASALGTPVRADVTMAVTLVVETVVRVDDPTGIPADEQTRFDVLASVEELASQFPNPPIDGVHRWGITGWDAGVFDPDDEGSVPTTTLDIAMTVTTHVRSRTE